MMMMMMLLQPCVVMMLLLQPCVAADDDVDVVIAFMLTDVDVSGFSFML
jgi:hypothetical protein